MSNVETFHKLDRDALQKLRARGLPKCTPEGIVKPSDGVDPAEATLLVEEIGKYLSSFLPYSNECACCGAHLCGVFIGTFTWGLTNGEGYCRACKYPARAIHRIGDIGTLSNLVLQYHPDELSFDEPAVAEARR